MKYSEIKLSLKNEYKWVGIEYENIFLKLNEKEFINGKRKGS